MVGRTRAKTFPRLLTAIAVHVIFFIAPTAGRELFPDPLKENLMDQIPLRPAEDPHAQGIRSTMETMRFTKPSAFSFSQRVRGQQNHDGLVPGYTSLRTEGEIHIKVSDRAASEQSIWVENEIRSHDPSLAHIAANENGMTGITIVSPPIVPLTQTTHDPFIFIKSTIYISPHLPLCSFYLQTSSLSIAIPNDIPLRPGNRNYIYISAPSSTLNFSSTSHFPSPLLIDARSTALTTTTGSIKGDFHLRDSLSIHTTSSSININLSLLPSSNSSSSNTPALLDLKSASGSITVRTATIAQPQKIPNRDYRSTIHTNSGSITASLVHGSYTDLKSDSGTIYADLYPHGNTTDKSPRSDISTRTLSGSTEVNVHPSLTNSTSPLQNFYAQYHGVSGSIRVSYPSQWEGRVEGMTVSGGIDVVWPGLRITENRSGWGSHRFKGVKGEGKGVLGFKDVSGRVELRGEQGVVVVGGSQGVRPGRVGNEDEEEGERGGREEDTETETETEGAEEGLLTPQSEAGDEWMLVQ